MRKLATVQRIAEVKPIPKADRICAYRVGGWWVVDAVGKYTVGDLAVFCEIDSWIPMAIAPFLVKGATPREFNGVPGERLRTVKLRGQLSQGLLLPISVLAIKTENGNYLGDWYQFEDHDVSERLGIVKWEAPIPLQLAGIVKSTFPSFIRKTDQERIQNLSVEFADWQINRSSWEVTEKLDGSSMTVFVNGDEFGVCSRNLWLKESEDNSFWREAKRERLIEKIRDTGRNYAFQGELCGPGIQGNKCDLKDIQFFLYDIFDIDRGEYISPNERRDICQKLEIPHVPVIDENFSLGNFGSIDDVLGFAERKTLFNASVEAEGVVFKGNQFRDSFKAISNKFLLNGGE